jgi:hypothetical protein
MVVVSMDDDMDHAAWELTENVLVKSETEPIAGRVKLYTILADYVPREEASARLRKYDEELQQIDLEFQRITPLF